MTLLKQNEVRTNFTQSIAQPTGFKSRLLAWAQQYREVVFLDSNEYHQQYSSYDCIVAVDAFTSIRTDYENGFADLSQYQQQTRDWLFGYVAYDLKNDTEELVSANYDGLGFPDLFFFQPKKLFLIKGNQVVLSYLRLCDDEIEDDLAAIAHFPLPEGIHNAVALKQRISREQYLEKVGAMLTHINLGDIYEANFCMEFYGEQVVLDPLSCYERLNSISKPPFATYFKNNAHYLLCASPERYLRKEGSKVISQPIKGTAKRYEDPVEDEKAKNDLAQHPKERSENIMIVDLVRNDLSRTATKGSVHVEELCGIYTFNQVHQMISTVVSTVEPSIPVVELVRTTFPMGSMTGAPKIAAMQIIEDLEETKRGLYSGAVGYFNPEGDFDFNVVIRSILYHAEKQYVSFSVGSAITAKAIPEEEYEECLLKAKAMFEVLQ